MDSSDRVNIQIKMLFFKNQPHERIFHLKKFRLSETFFTRRVRVFRRTHTQLNTFSLDFHVKNSYFSLKNKLKNHRPTVFIVTYYFFREYRFWIDRKL